MNSSKIGSCVDSWCTRCKMILAHTVEAMLGTQIKRVSCNTCQGKHQYRATAPGTSAASRARGLATPSPNHYDALMQGKDLAGMLIYSFQTKYARGALLSHPDFGVGVVVADKGSNKIEVSFAAGTKVLVHGHV